MTPKRFKILTLLGEGKTYKEIKDKLNINLSNLHSTIYQMKRDGVLIPGKPPASKEITPTQRKVLTGYMEHKSIPDIAKELGINCQTVMNHAAQGFARLGLARIGEDRVAALRDILNPTPLKPGDRVRVISGNNCFGSLDNHHVASNSYWVRLDGCHGTLPFTADEVMVVKSLPITMDDPFFN